MTDQKRKMKEVRMAAARLGIFTVTELASRLSCSRTALYEVFRDGRPMGKVSEKLHKLLHG